MIPRSISSVNDKFLLREEIDQAVINDCGVRSISDSCFVPCIVAVVQRTASDRALPSRYAVTEIVDVDRSDAVDDDHVAVLSVRAVEPVEELLVFIRKDRILAIFYCYRIEVFCVIFGNITAVTALKDGIRINGVLSGELGELCFGSNGSDIAFCLSVVSGGNPPSARVCY